MRHQGTERWRCCCAALFYLQRRGAPRYAQAARRRPAAGDQAPADRHSRRGGRGGGGAGRRPGTAAAVGSAPHAAALAGPLLAETPLERFVVLFALQGTSSAAIRHEACNVLHALWLHATVAERSVLFGALCARRWRGLPLYGANSRELMAMVGRHDVGG